MSQTIEEGLSITAEVASAVFDAIVNDPPDKVIQITAMELRLVCSGFLMMYTSGMLEQQGFDIDKMLDESEDDSRQATFTTHH